MKIQIGDTVELMNGSTVAHVAKCFEIWESGIVSVEVDGMQFDCYDTQRCSPQEGNKFFARSYIRSK